MWWRVVIRILKKLCCVHLLTRLKALLMFVVKIFARVQEHNFVKFENRKGIVNHNFSKQWIPSGIVFRRNLKISSLYLRCLYCSVFLDSSHLLYDHQTNHLKEQCNRWFYQGGLRSYNWIFVTYFLFSYLMNSIYLSNDL